jgi:uncharacterized protein (TIGR02646 family)
MDSAGNEIGFAEYGHARPYLTRRIGAYCSYCERPMSSDRAIEHVRQKHRNPELEREWTNFLLACRNCNSNKGTKVETAADLDRYLWPHRDRTLDAFDYTVGRVRLAQTKDVQLRHKAKNTAALVGLTKRPGAGLTRQQLMHRSDNRWDERDQAWDEATSAREDLRAVDTPRVRQLILKLARKTGFWSVWMTVFRDDEQMQRALCDEQVFLGTATARVFPVPRHARASARG